MKSLVLILALGATPALAGNEIGNGGDAVVCQTPQPALGGRKAMVLDLYEAMSRWHLTPDLGPSGLDVDAKAILVFSRIQHLDPDRYARYKSHVLDFWNEANLVPNLSLPSIPDAGVIELPAPDCQVVQLAFQQNPELPGDKRYNIKKEVWDLLDDDSQADLLVHEIIYREAIEKGATNSRASRYFNAQLAANAVAAMSVGAYCALLDQLVKLPALRTFQGAPFSLCSLNLDAGGRPLSGEIAEMGALDGRYGPIRVDRGQMATFSPAGRVATLSQDSQSPLAFYLGPNCIAEDQTAMGVGMLHLDDSGAIVQIDPAAGNTAYLSLRACRADAAPYTLEFNPTTLAVTDGVITTPDEMMGTAPVARGMTAQLNGPTTLHPNGWVATTHLIGEPQKFYGSDGKGYTCEGAVDVAFDEAGYLVKGCGL